MIIPALRIFAYVCIWTTPIQVAIALWGLGIVILTEYSILSLTNIEFIRNYAGFFIPIVEWLYTWFWNTFLDWLFPYQSSYIKHLRQFSLPGWDFGYLKG